ncbi:hypothetical protein [Chitinophaga varians]|uniref:hypothetical protein n=1 Tax=Chitinophaga varians TaxID=2202339 RepID=UPI00165F8A66|nr:hypothetical protein [Chitinophaga varians]MBC9909327.1 hypothetical protein [Chitinophaga varians]
MEKTATKECLRILLVVFSTFYSVLLVAQNTDPACKHVTISTPEVQFNRLFEILHTQTGARFSINTGKFPSTKKVRIKPGRHTLGEVLIQLRHQTGIEYHQVAGYMVITDGIASNNSIGVHPQKRPVKPTRVLLLHCLKPANRSYRPHLPHIPTGVHLPAGVIDSKITVAGYDSVPANYNLSQKTDTLHTIGINSRSFEDKKTRLLKIDYPLIPILPSHIHSAFCTPYFAMGGYIDENSLINVYLNGGFRYLYLTMALSKNDRFGLFRYGLGSNFELNKHNDLNVNLTYSNIRNTYPNTFDTSGKQMVTIKGKHLQVKVNLERRINDHWALLAGISLNAFFHTHYTGSNPTPSSLDRERYFSDYTLVRTPVILYNSYSANKSTNFISWIGFQLGISYTINPVRKRVKKECPMPYP